MSDERDAKDSRDHTNVVNGSVICTRDEHPPAAHERPQDSDDSQSTGQAAGRTELAMRDVGDEDEEESGAGREGDQELEQVAFGEPVSDGAAVALFTGQDSLRHREKGEQITPRRKGTTLEGTHNTVSPARARAFSFDRGVGSECKGLLTWFFTILR